MRAWVIYGKIRIILLTAGIMGLARISMEWVGSLIDMYVVGDHKATSREAVS